MDLIDRYLHAVRRNLPADKADDIVAELRDDICSRVEDREDSMGRALTKDETSALLKEVGHPLVVASRYRKHQYLIGPEVFPFYFAAMRIVLMIVVAIVFTVSAAKALFAGGDMMRIWVQGMQDIWVTVLLNAGIVTLVFAVLERVGFPAAHIMKWVPDQLPDIVDKQKGPWEAAFEVAVSLGFLLWWAGFIPTPIVTNRADFSLTPSPVFMQLYWPILALAAARLVHNVIEWVRPRWKGVLAVTGVATAVGGLILLAIIYQAGHWVTVVPHGMAAEQAGKLQESLDLSLRIAIVVAGFVWTLGCLGAVWRAIRAPRAIAG